MMSQSKHYPAPTDVRNLSGAPAPVTIEMLHYIANTILEETPDDTSAMSYDGAEDVIVYHLRITEADRACFELLTGVEEIWLLYDAKVRES